MLNVRLHMVTNLEQVVYTCGAMTRLLQVNWTLLLASPGHQQPYIVLTSWENWSCFP